MNKEHKYKDKYYDKDNDKDKDAKRITESLTVCFFFEKMSFFGGCFPLLWVIFRLLTLIQSDDMDILQKELVQNAHSYVK